MTAKEIRGAVERRMNPKPHVCEPQRTGLGERAFCRCGRDVLTRRAALSDTEQSR